MAEAGKPRENRAGHPKNWVQRRQLRLRENRRINVLGYLTRCYQARLDDKAAPSLSAYRLGCRGGLISHRATTSPSRYSAREAYIGP